MPKINSLFGQGGAMKRRRERDTSSFVGVDEFGCTTTKAGNLAADSVNIPQITAGETVKNSFLSQQRPQVVSAECYFLKKSQIFKKRRIESQHSDHQQHVERQCEMSKLSDFNQYKSIKVDNCKSFLQFDDMEKGKANIYTKRGEFALNLKDNFKFLTERVGLLPGHTLCLNIPLARAIQCNICSKVFSPLAASQLCQSLKRHYSAKHSINVTLLFSCRFCEEDNYILQASRNALTTHVQLAHEQLAENLQKQVHELEKSCCFKCIICDKSFPSDKALSCHSAKHKILKTGYTNLKEIRQSLESKLTYKPRLYLTHQDNSNLVETAATFPTTNSEESLNVNTENLGINIKEILVSPTLENVSDLTDPYKFISDDTIDYYISNILLKSSILNREEYIYVPPVINANIPSINKQSLFNYLQEYSKWKYVILPLNVNNSHWVIVLMERESNNILLVDPLHQNISGWKNFLGYISEIWCFLPGNSLNLTYPTMTVLQDHPRQEDAYNCGIHICLCAEQFIRNPREAIIYEIDNMYKYRLDMHEKMLNFSHIYKQKCQNELYEIEVKKTSISTSTDIRNANVVNSLTSIDKRCKKRKLKDSQTTETIIKKRPDGVPHSYLPVITPSQQKTANKTIDLSINKCSHKDSKEVQVTIDQIKCWYTSSENPDWRIFETIVDTFAGFIKKPLPKRSNNTNSQREYSKNNSSTSKSLSALYYRSKKTAFQNIVQSEKIDCDLEVDVIEKYFRDVYSCNNYNNNSQVNIGALKTLIIETYDNTPKITSNDNVIIEDRLLGVITSKEVLHLIKKHRDTCPGEDNIKYSDLLKIDPYCKALSSLYNVCLKHKRVPQRWKMAKVILLHKKGVKSDPSNYRPIALMNTMYKLYTSIMAERLNNVNKTFKLINKHQKGFIPESEGCMEHIFQLDDLLNKARSKKQDLSVMWIDLSNAFGSIPHDVINTVLNSIGLPRAFADIVKDMYTNAFATLQSKRGETCPLEIKRGVKQGDPLSPILFNLAIEPILRTVANLKEHLGFKGYDNKYHNVQAFADDIVLIANSPEALDYISTVADNHFNMIGLSINVSKCATLCLNKGKLKPHQFKLNNEKNIPTLNMQDAYSYLGNPCGIGVDKCPRNIIESCMTNLEKIANSRLLPWQKLDCIKTFLLPKMAYLFRCSSTPIAPLIELDKMLTNTIKYICHVGNNATSNYFFGAKKRGCLGFFSFKEEYYLQGISQAFRLLTTPDNDFNDQVWCSLRETVTKWSGEKSCCSNENILRFLNGQKSTAHDSTDTVSNTWSHVSSVWTKTRKCCRELNKLISLKFLFNDRGELKVTFDFNGKNESCYIDPSNRKQIYRCLRIGISNYHSINLMLNYKSQGSNIKSIKNSPITNKLLLNGKITDIGEWKFIHRARLNLLALRDNARYKIEDRKCRRCGHPHESTHHVLGTCPYRRNEFILERHNHIQREVIKIVTKKTDFKLHSSDTCCTVAGRTVRPDIILKNEKVKKLIILDICCPGESNDISLEYAYNFKINKYQQESQAFQQLGWTTHCVAIVVGDLGSWYYKNDQVLLNIGLSKKDLNSLRTKLIRDTITFSKDKYWAHILGDHFNLTDKRNIYQK